MGWVLIVAGLVMAWLGGTGSYPGVDPAGASNSTTAAIVMIGTAVVALGMVLVAVSWFRRRSG